MHMITLSLLIIWSLTACNLAASPSEVQQMPSTPAPPVVQVPIQLKTFHDTELGIAFEYPEDWRIERVSNGIQLYSPQTALTTSSPDVTFSGDTKIEFLRMDYNLNSLQEEIEQRRQHSGGPGGSVLEDEFITLPGGIEVNRHQVTGGAIGEHVLLAYIADVDGVLFQIVSYGDPVPLDAMMQTLREAL